MQSSRSTAKRRPELASGAKLEDFITALREIYLSTDMGETERRGPPSEDNPAEGGQANWS